MVPSLLKAEIQPLLPWLSLAMKRRPVASVPDFKISNSSPVGSRRTISLLMSSSRRMTTVVLQTQVSPGRMLDHGISDAVAVAASTFGSTFGSGSAVTGASSTKGRAVLRNMSAVLDAMTLAQPSSLLAARILMRLPLGPEPSSTTLTRDPAASRATCGLSKSSCCRISTAPTHSKTISGEYLAFGNSLDGSVGVLSSTGGAVASLGSS
mmetsp:Transcript_30197/g.65110  ORF Transcript_30197/g.65110 Transcript_30197/m.65110 type:complete len:209 (+) Transcript_30197:850-1476(+)